MDELIIIQARMSSSRLPGKILADLGSVTLLELLIRRLRTTTSGLPLVVATSDQADDDPVESFCQARTVNCFRGSLRDVAGRFLAAGQEYGAERLVRICADSPLLDPGLVDQLVTLSAVSGADLTTNVQVRTYPAGQSVEVLRTAALANALQDMNDEDREHVTRYFYRNMQSFVIVNLTSGRPWGATRLTVDTPEDLQSVRHLVAMLPGNLATVSLEEIMAVRNKLFCHG